MKIGPEKTTQTNGINTKTPTLRYSTTSLRIVVDSSSNGAHSAAPTQADSFFRTRDIFELADASSQLAKQ